MITKNDKQFNITFKAIDKSNVKNNLIIQENGYTSLISEENTIYYFVNDEKCLCELEKNLEKIFKNNKYDLNVDVDSFIKIFNKQETFQKVVETILFATHEDLNYKEKNNNVKAINFMFNEKYNNVYENSLIKLEYMSFARNIQDLPPNLGTSIEVTNLIEKKAKEIDGLKVTIYDKKQIEEMNMNLLLSVNAGSHIDARVAVLEYNSDSNQKKVALVGKGITFDTGGYNLKPSNYIENMKFDKSGAAIVCSTVMALAKAKAKTNVVAIALLTDNRIGGHATLTESVIKSMNGKTVEITNTDAEGRLVLADGITYAIRNEKADKVITIATLTGSITIALGKWFTGLFASNDDFYNEFLLASNKAQEKVWRLPMIRDHLKAMQCSKVADLVNSEPGREAGSSTAAAFLNSFAEGKEFIHLDIAGTADTNKRGRAPMLKTIFELLKK